MESSLRLGRIAGIDVRADWSLLPVFGLLGWSLSTGILPLEVPGHTLAAYGAAALASVFLFHVSLLAHELAHAVVARRMGVVVEGITLWLFGGTSRLSGDRVTAVAELRIAMVGPAVNLGLAAAFALLAFALNGAHVFGLVAGVSQWLAGINTALAIFNLLPGLPLDGGRMLHAILWRLRRDGISATRTAGRVGIGFGFLLIGAGILELFMAGQVAGGLWLAFSGWSLLTAAKAAEFCDSLRQALTGLKVQQVMSPAPLVAPDWITVDKLIRVYVLPHRLTTLPVRDLAGNLSGLVTLPRLKAVPMEARPARRVGDIALPYAEVTKARPTDTLVGLIDRLGDIADRAALVLDGGHPVGVVAGRHLSQALKAAELRVQACRGGSR